MPEKTAWFLLVSIKVIERNLLNAPKARTSLLGTRLCQANKLELGLGVASRSTGRPNLLKVGSTQGRPESSSVC